MAAMRSEHRHWTFLHTTSPYRVPDVSDRQPGRPSRPRPAPLPSGSIGANFDTGGSSLADRKLAAFGGGFLVGLLVGGMVAEVPGAFIGGFIGGFLAASCVH